MSSHDSLLPNPPLISNGRSFDDEAGTVSRVRDAGEVLLGNVIYPVWFRKSTADLQYTLLNLVQECSWTDWEIELPKVKHGKVFDLERACRRLAIVQDREPREILKYVMKLWEFDFLKLWGFNPANLREFNSVMDTDLEEGKDLTKLDFWKGRRWFLKLGLHEKISKQLLCKYPHLKTYHNIFPMEQSCVQYVKVLSLFQCEELGDMDLREFPHLRSLSIWRCPNFYFLTGWRFARGLGSLEIRWCDSYRDFPDVQHVFSLREFQVQGRKCKISPVSWQVAQFNQCIKLRRLEVADDESLSEHVDFEGLDGLECLDYLSILSCSVSSIRGLSALQGLTTLRLRDCRALTRVPDLGCLKRLTHLDLTFSSVEDVVGVEELHLLTTLDLRGCKSLKWLPFLGHLEALVSVDVTETALNEIPGREDLSIWRPCTKP